MSINNENIDTIPMIPPPTMTIPHQHRFNFVITGTAAHSRIAPLVPPDWYDETPSFQSIQEDNTTTAATTDDDDDDTVTTLSSPKIHFLWENCPFKETKTYRDHVKCYSHLPNGITLLDDKGKVAQLLSSHQHHHSCSSNNNNNNESKNMEPLAILKTVVFQGKEGWYTFLQQTHHHTMDSSSKTTTYLEIPTTCSCCGQSIHLASKNDSQNTTTTMCWTCSYFTQNVWVIKDVHSNGASGIWFLNTTKMEIPLSLFPHSIPRDPQSSRTTRFVAQRYAWPLLLFQNRKFHIRVYVMFTCYGDVFIHKCAFLHVANQDFQYPTTHTTSTTTTTQQHQDDSVKIDIDKQQEIEFFEPSMHITNCCANSHDTEKFTGEICADLTQYLDDTSKTSHSSSCCSSAQGNIPTTNKSSSSLFSPFYENTISSSYKHSYPSSVIPLGEFFPSIVASVQTLAQQSFYFLQGGEANHSFEYLGLDFILSYRPFSSSSSSSISTTTTVTTIPHPITFHGIDYIPLAYLLEVNAPPSQDTATGLPHAEALHNQVLRDWMHYWVIPHVMSKSPDSNDLGGWIPVYKYKVLHEKTLLTEGRIITPSQSAWLNKIRWALYEKKMKKQYRHGIIEPGTQSPLPSSRLQKPENKCPTIELSWMDAIITEFRRQYFPYFQGNEWDGGLSMHRRPWIYFENAGGTQVPSHVIHSMTESLSHRHREIKGSQDKALARTVFSWFLRAPLSSYEIFFGQNATSLFDRLAHVMIENKWLQKSDEIIIAIENHRAHVDPWVRLKKYGINVLWWKSYSMNSTSPGVESAETSLRALLTPKTRLVCLSHASNILGSIRKLKNLSTIIRDHEMSREGNRTIQIVVDGVGAASHVFPNVAYEDIDWYIISCQKFYGPTMGVLSGKKKSVQCLLPSFDDHPSNTIFETGTMNYEACAGVSGLWMYFYQLAKLNSSLVRGKVKPYEEPVLVHEISLLPGTYDKAVILLDRAFECIAQVEAYLFSALMERLTRYRNLILIRDTTLEIHRSPVVCFLHKQIDPLDIVQHCLKHGIIIRASTFLATEFLLHDLGIMDTKRGMVRLSLCHYNTLLEVHELLDTLESMDEW